jgi:serine/threonine-protein kinase
VTQAPPLDAILPPAAPEGARRAEEADQQVAQITPFPAVKGPPLREQGPQRPERIEKVVRYVEQYDGGNCFYVAPVEVSETKARLEGYGPSDEPFRALNDAFLHENGYEATIDVRLVAPAQCPAVTFLGRLRGVSAPHLRIDGTRLSPRAPLTGTVDSFKEGSIELLLVTDSGAVQNVSRLLKPDRSGKRFTIAYPDLGKGAAGQPQLLIAIATLKPFEALRFDGAVAATRLFPALLAEGLRTNQPVAAAARYFKVEE